MDEDAETEIEALKAKIVTMFHKSQNFLQEKKEADEAANFMWTVLKNLNDGWHAFHTAPLDEDDKNAILRWVRRYVDMPDRTWCYREYGSRMSFIFAFRHASDCAKAKLMFDHD
jgi:hypothetical protein